MSVTTVSSLTAPNSQDQATGPTTAPSSGEPRRKRGRPRRSEQKTAETRLPRISLVTPPSSRYGYLGTWDDSEYEQLCFDLLHEQAGAGAPQGAAATANATEHADHPQPTQVLDRIAPAGFSQHSYDTDFFYRQRTSSSALPGAKRWSSQFTCAYVEVLNGRRGTKQIERWLTSRISRQVRSDILRKSRQSQSSISIHSLHVSEPLDSVIEGSCVVRENSAFKAMTFRFEGWDGKWICTHLRIHA